MKPVTSTDSGKVGGRLIKDSDSDCQESEEKFGGAVCHCRLLSQNTEQGNFVRILQPFPVTDIHDSRPSSYLSRSRFLGVPRCEW